MVHLIPEIFVCCKMWHFTIFYSQNNVDILLSDWRIVKIEGKISRNSEIFVMVEFLNEFLYNSTQCSFWPLFVHLSLWCFSFSFDGDVRSFLLFFLACLPTFHSKFTNYVLHLWRTKNSVKFLILQTRNKTITWIFY